MKVLCIALVVLVVFALGDAKSIRSLKSRRHVRSLLPRSSIATRAIQSMTDVAILTAGASGKRNAAPKPEKLTESEEAALGLLVLDEALSESKRALKTTQRKRLAKPTSSEEAAEAIVGLAVLDELANEAKRSYTRSIRNLKRQKPATSEEALEALVGIGVLEELASEVKRQAAKRSFFKGKAPSKKSVLKRRALKPFFPFM